MNKTVIEPPEIDTTEVKQTSASGARQSANQNPTFTEKDKVLLKAMGIASGHQQEASNPWEKDIHEERAKAFNETATGRLAIRVISRGVFGAAFFAIGGHIASRHMENYDATKSFKEIFDEVRKGREVISDVPGYKRVYPWLQLCAKLIDMTAGKAIKGTVKALGYSHETAENAVMFRPFRAYFIGEGRDAKKVQGYSLGHESVMRTFDFAMASVGDSFAREYLVGLIDPNVKLSWIKREKFTDEHGKVHEKKSIDFPRALKAFGAMVWDIFSYRQMEDWAVAIPYVYQIRAQKHLLNKISPGFEYDSDWATNGGSFKVKPSYYNKNDPDALGRPEDGKLVFKGNYNMEGIIDLTFRFTGYNIGTLMFREGYHKLGDTIKQWWDTGKTPDIHLPSGVSDIASGIAGGTYSTVKYLLKSAIKGSIYMLPSAFTFGVLRASQFKDLGLAICDENQPAGKAPYADATTEYGPAHLLSIDPKYEKELLHMGMPLNAQGLPIHNINEMGKDDPRRVLLNVAIRRVYVNASGAEFGKFSQDYHHHVSDPKAGKLPESDKRSSVYLYDKARLDFFKEWLGGQNIHAKNLKNPFRKKIYDKENIGKNFEPFSISNTFYDPFTNYIGRLSEGLTNYSSSAIAEMGKYHDESILLKSRFSGLTGEQQKRLMDHRQNSLKSIARTAGMAAFAYTPYMYMKAELASKWDTPHMDLAINRAIDGVFHLNLGEFKAGIAEISSAIRNEPFQDPKREAEAQKENKHDKLIGDDTDGAPPEIPDGYGYMRNISKRELPKPSDFATQSLQTIIAQKIAEPKKPWAEQNKDALSKEQNAPTSRNIN